MRVYVSSTPEELTPYRAAVVGVIRELGNVALTRNPDGLPGFLPVAACARQIASADAALVLVGRRRGEVPAPGSGGDGFHPWSWWEARAAFERGLPVVVLMTSDDWHPELREESADARAVMRDFRGELGRLATLFRDGPGESFRKLVREKLSGSVPRAAESAGAPAGVAIDGTIHLRRWPPPQLPGQPYPVLLPYTHPDLMAGRDRELEEIRHLLARPIPILGLHAPSGTGKSSFLYGGLVPRLRAEGRAVAIDRHPCEAGILRRLLGDLFDEGEAAALEDGDFHGFVDRLQAAGRLAGGPPVLVLDQFEDLLRHRSERRARATVGAFLAASVQRLPGMTEAPCRWLLAYRQEFHGDVFQWLSDALRDAHAVASERAEEEAAAPFTEALPHDLSSPERFHAWALSPLGTPPPGTSDRAGAAARVFQAAIEKPLDLRSPDGDAQGPLYPWRFVGDGAVRLARAFGEARVARRNAPLAPELQVVLAHLLDASFKTDDEGRKLVEVPEDPAVLIDRALEEHLQRSLDAAFPAGRTAGAVLGRTRALLALRELADAHGQRDAGRTVTVLAQAIGHDGREVLEKLATPQARLVLREERDDQQIYVLSHDRMAEVVVRLVDDAGAYPGLGVDMRLLSLRRFVALQRELFSDGEVEQGTEVPKSYYKRIRQHTDALLWDEDGRRWWAVCQERHRRKLRRRLILRGAAVVALVLLALMVRTSTKKYLEQRELLQVLASGEPEVSFEAMARLTSDSGVDSAGLLAKVRERERPFDILERGLGGLAPEERGPALLRVVEHLLPLLAEDPEDPVRIASTIWALDFFAVPDPVLQQEALALRDEILEPLRKIHPPPPPPPPPGDPHWADVPAGTFQMGSGPGDGRDREDQLIERPKHRVRLSGFRLMTHEVTNAELRRLYPDATGEDDLPAVRLSWYQAYTYAAWLGGRLPTEPEWEYAARAGCPHAYCRRDGTEATLDEVGWWSGNAADAETGEVALKKVMQLEPNPWGLYDVYGNVWEMTANWYYIYPEEDEVDPPVATNSLTSYRMCRGGSVADGADKFAASSRRSLTPENKSTRFGFRVALPAFLEEPTR